MANLEGKLSQKGDAIYLTIAELYLQALNKKMQEVKGQSLSVKQGYMSKYDLVDELRNMLKDKTTKPEGVGDAEWSEIQPLLEPTKSIEDIGKVKESYNKLQDFMNNLASQQKGLFNPTLANPFKTSTHEKVFPIPSSGAFDPRRHGRLLMVGKITDPGVKKWLTNNSPLYGFVMYEDYGLYFSGLGEIKAAGSSKTKLAKLINQFQSTPIPDSDITITTATLAAAEDALGIDFDPIIEIPAGTVDNNNSKPDLVRVDNNTMSKKIFDDYRAMFIAAKSAGITIIVGSGFRPATTGGTWKSQSGKTGTFTSQVGCRTNNLIAGSTSTKSADGKWGLRSGMEYILYYTNSSTYFKPQTAKPGSSNHGTGQAVDLNTGEGNAAKNSPVYNWLAHNSWKYGFVRGVSTEEWHFEHLKSIKNKVPTSPFDIVPQSNSLWYNIFANGIGGGGVDTSNLGVINPTALSNSQGQHDIVTKIATMLRGIGMTQAGATGMIGNILGESGALPWAYEKTNWTIGGIGGVGLAQWTAKRRRNLEKAYSSDIGKMKSLTNQLSFLKGELQSNYKSKVLNPLKSINSVEEATIIVLEKFEVPGSYLAAKKPDATPADKEKYLATKRKRIGLGLGAAPYVAKAYV